jgi:hypothetical protein
MQLRQISCQALWWWSAEGRVDLRVVDGTIRSLLSRNVARLVQLRVTDDRKVRSFKHDQAVQFLQSAQHHRLYAAN